MPPINGQKLSQTTAISSSDNEHYLPVFKINISNQRIKVFDLIEQIKELINAYTKPEIDLFLDEKAQDSNVIHKTGFESIEGQKDFHVFPLLPADTPTEELEATHKKYVDELIQGLQEVIDTLIFNQNNRWIVPEIEINAISNPNYPAALKGQTFKITGDGKIGGINGRKVYKGDIVLAIQDNVGGAEDASGSKFLIVSRGIVKSSNSDFGVILTSTNLSVIAGTALDEAVTPATLQYKINQQLVKKSALKTLRFYFGAGTAPTGYTVINSLSPVLSHSSLVGITIYGMCFIDNSPFDYMGQCDFNQTNGTLDLTAFADMTSGNLYDGQKLVLTAFS